MWSTFIRLIKAIEQFPVGIEIVKKAMGKYL
jgi:hypothetical protein